VRASTAQELQGLEEIWNIAHLKGDVNTLENLWTDDVVIALPKMPLFGKAQILTMWRSSAPKFSKYETSNIAIREYGDAAVVTGRLRRTRDFGGHVASEDWQFTKVYVRSGSTWRVASYHASESSE
jgi:ketosteroid isomerase-like protein